MVDGSLPTGLRGEIELLSGNRGLRAQKLTVLTSIYSFYMQQSTLLFWNIILMRFARIKL
jgi:hypothetical protein